ncbi:S8 family peptidase [Brevibacillus ginsengisoli]|uniref:S8 family peptidase n=1 Tax=Brevibacillus ginsengisoli TaxID=363854 RepID=UPI003CEF350E
MKKTACLLMALSLGITTLTGLPISKSFASSEKTYLVLFKDDSNLPKEYQKVIKQAGGNVKKELKKLGAVEVTTDNPNFLEEIKDSNLVQDVGVENRIQQEKAVDVEAFDEESISSKGHDLYNKYQWDIKQVTDNGESWNLPGGDGKSSDGQDIVIGIIDTGIDYTHPDIKANYLYGKSFVPGIDDAMDEDGHGTHVAGSIAANGRVMGIGPNLKLAAYRVFGPTGDAATADIAAALMEAGNDNVDVVNMSLGGYDWYQDPELATKDVVADVRLFNRAITYAIKKGVTVVGSAGNANLDLSSPGQISKGNGGNGATHRSPSNQQLIRVASNGEAKNRAYYSNYGVGKIDVTAPGGDYGLAWLETGDKSLRDPYKRCLSTVPGGYAWYIGTSMASPKTTAMAGVIIAQHGKDKLSPAQVKHIIQSTAIDINKPGYDEDSGFGLINAVNALK